MKKIIIIILLSVFVTGIMGFALAKKVSQNETTKITEEIHPLSSSDRMETVNILNDEQWD